LDGADVISILEQVRRERMPKGMTASFLLNACFAQGFFYGALHVLFGDMVSSGSTCTRID